jgi:hypothetical protein
MADTITLEFLAARVGVLTDEMHDLKLRFGMMEACPAAARDGVQCTRSAVQRIRKPI